MLQHDDVVGAQQLLLAPGDFSNLTGGSNVADHQRKRSRGALLTVAQLLDTRLQIRPTAQVKSAEAFYGDNFTVLQGGRGRSTDHQATVDRICVGAFRDTPRSDCIQQ